MDLLLWVDALFNASGLSGFVRSHQGLERRPKPAHERLWWHRSPRNLQLGPAPPDVHVCSAERVRKPLARSRDLTSPARASNADAILRRSLFANSHERSRQRRRGPASHRVSLPSQGHLQLRGQSLRRQRNFFQQARNSRRVRRQRTMVAGTEAGHRRDWHRTKQLSHSIMSSRRNETCAQADASQWLQWLYQQRTHQDKQEEARGSQGGRAQEGLARMLKVGAGDVWQGLRLGRQHIFVGRRFCTSGPPCVVTATAREQQK